MKSLRWDSRKQWDITKCAYDIKWEISLPVDCCCKRGKFTNNKLLSSHQCKQWMRSNNEIAYLEDGQEYLLVIDYLMTQEKKENSQWNQWMTKSEIAYLDDVLWVGGKEVNKGRKHGRNVSQLSLCTANKIIANHHQSLPGGGASSSRWRATGSPHPSTGHFPVKRS